MDDNDQEPDGRAAVAAAFGGSIDPLGKHEVSFTSLAVDPFERYRTAILDERDHAVDARDTYTRLIQRRCDHVAREWRHLAYPNDKTAISPVSDTTVDDR